MIPCCYSCKNNKRLKLEIRVIYILYIRNTWAELFNIDTFITVNSKTYLFVFAFSVNILETKLNNKREVKGKKRNLKE